MKRAISLIFTVFFISLYTHIKAQEVLQSDIEPLNNSLLLISKLQPIRFNYDKKWQEKLKLPDYTYYGFDTKDVEKFLPDVVYTQSKDYPVGKNTFKTATIKKVNYESLIPLLVGSIKAQQQQIEILKQELKTLKSQMAK